ncbi:hypothetical protein C9374_011115 [Naegleria lovaniensis]|uniref:Uncharacterized protein n=1 Tax=Naegleria lovaniensis TaxID=51637 RepID=A0AA88GCL1_NAELO|nr:uncharacterized protein C9374_011115 [Naegleria lovaniensis]KAG2374036.1 hypothetical protein C9374_011115 [Naegleria lovaniensis]
MNRFYVHYCGDVRLSGLRPCTFQEQDTLPNEDQECYDEYVNAIRGQFVELEYKDSLLDKDTSGWHTDHQKDHKSEHKESSLNISYICTGGEEISYTLLFLNGHEQEFFLLAASPGVDKLQKVYFTNLFLQMSQAQSNSTDSTANLFRGIREMKQIICNNKNSVVFEMLDGELYLFDVPKMKLFPFAVPHKKTIKRIGSGIMSPYILVNTMDTDEIMVLRTEEEEQDRKIIFSERPADIKFMKCCFEPIFIFVLKNNWMYAWKDGAHNMSFDFPDKTVSRLATGFESEGNVIGIDTGYAHVVVLLDNGAVYTRGLNNFGQCLDHNIHVLEFKKFVLTCPIVSVHCGSICTCVMTRNEIAFFGEVSGSFKKQSDLADEYKSFTSVCVRKKQFSDEQVSLGTWHGFIYRNSFQMKQFNTHFIRKLGERVNNDKLSDVIILTGYSPGNYASPGAVQTPGNYGTYSQYSPGAMSPSPPMTTSPGLSPGGAAMSPVATPNPFQETDYQARTGSSAAVTTTQPTVPSGRREKIVAVTYVCGHCAKLNTIKQDDVIRCRECGYRILYKQRTTRKIQFEAR